MVTLLKHLGSRNIPPPASLILLVFLSNIVCTCFVQSGTIYTAAGLWIANIYVNFTSTTSQILFFYQPARLFQSSYQLVELLPAGRIFAGMAHWPTSILIFTSCQIIYIPCLYDELIAFAGMAQWSARIPLTGQLAFISQLVGIFKTVCKPAENECILTILHIS